MNPCSGPEHKYLKWKLKQVASVNKENKKSDEKNQQITFTGCGKNIIFNILRY